MKNIGFNYYNILIICLLIVFSASCSNRGSNKATELSKFLNTKLNVEVCDSVIYKDSIVSFKEIRKKFEFIWIVNLKISCNPCYKKYIEWQNEIDKINTKDNFTVLFIIEGSDFYAFNLEIQNICNISNKYCVAMDNDYRFLDSNRTIPKWIIDSGILIDSNDKIKMVGQPWVNKKMATIFENICNKSE